ncbi:MAG TPA: hypothetical protein VH478_13730 [Trebonia sp.]|jgi:hypothetical protein|nr:hypothetical protein [Trebonia sp.]
MADPGNASVQEQLDEAAASAEQAGSARDEATADREDWAALTAHLADKAAGMPGIRLEDLDVALERVKAG